MINVGTPEGVAEYFETLKKIREVKVKEELAKQVIVARPPKRKRVIGFETTK